MFPLSKNVWMKLKNYTNNDLNTITTTGKFRNKILILKVLETVYCLFFLDDKGKIRQGYLEFFGKGYEEVKARQIELREKRKMKRHKEKE